MHQRSYEGLYQKHPLQYVEDIVIYIFHFFEYNIPMLEETGSTRQPLIANS